ncbi:MAG: GNAT family N-acetyltransferase [Pseudomonadota bacterium]
MRVGIVSSASEFMEMQESWARLLGQYEDEPLPLTHHWLYTWWQVFGEGCKLKIVTVFMDAKLVVVAPFLLERIWFRGLVPVTQQKLMGNEHSPFCDVIVDPGLSAQDQRAALKAVVDESAVDLLSFYKIPRESMLRSFVSEYQAPGRLLGESRGRVTPIIGVSDDWDEFLKGKSRKFRKSLNNKLNRIKREKSISVSRYSVESRDDSRLQDMLSISMRSWKREIGTDLGSNQSGYEFLLSLADVLGPKGKMNIWLMYDDTTPIAYELHLLHGRVAYPINADYAEEFRRLSPGSVLEYTALKTLFEEGQVAQYYSCANDYWYLRNWSKERQHLVTIHMASKRPLGMALYGLEYTVVPIIRQLRDRLSRWLKRNKVGT